MKKRLAAVLTMAAMALGMLSGCGAGSSGAAASAAEPTAAAAADTKAAEPTASAGEETASADVSSVWPDGTTVYIDVPAKAGGGTDLYTRYLTQALGEVCPKVNFVVTNYDTEEVGMQHVKNAKADGRTLLTCHGGAAIKKLTGASGVSIRDDMRAVGLLNQGGPQAIIANPGAPYKNFSELAEYIKAHPGELTVGCSLGGTTQILFTSFMQALLGEPSLVNYVQCSSEADDKDGKLTVLGTIGPKASNLESMGKLLGTELDAKFASTVEQGIDTTWDSNYYVLAPAGVSDEAAAAINAAIVAAETQSSYIDGMNKMATFNTPAELAAAQDALNAEWEKLDALVGSMGLKK